MECRENKNPTQIELDMINDKLLDALSLLRLLETDIYADCSDGVHYRAVKIIQGIIDYVQKEYAVKIIAKFQ